jgi:hypothetical protein
MKNTILSLVALTKTRRRVLLAVTLLLAAFLGSAPVRADHRAVVGAIIGGTTGALVGDSMGGRDGAIIGGTLGAVAGAALTQADYRPHTGYAPPPPYYRLPPVVAPAPIYYERYDRDRDWDRRDWDRRHRHEEFRHRHHRDWDRDGYRR